MRTLTKIWLGISFISVGVGIALVIVALVSGVKVDETMVFSEKTGVYENVDSVKFDISYGEVKIIKGNTFSFKAENILEDQLESYVEDGIWYIREGSNKFINVFGVEFPLGFVSHYKDKTPKITITIPEDFIAEKFHLSVSAGRVIVEELIAKEGDFSVSAGVLHIDGLKINERSNYTLGSGEMILNNVEVGDITVDCGIGSVKIDGTITGDNRIDCGMGDVNLQLSGNKQDYSYDLSSSIGKLTIGDKKFKGITNEVINNKEADHKLYLSCEVGSITVDFN